MHLLQCCINDISERDAQKQLRSAAPASSNPFTAGRWHYALRYNMSYLARQVVKLHEADYFVLLESSSHAVLKMVAEILKSNTLD